MASQDEGQEKALIKATELNNSQRLIGYWAAHGWNAKEIAEELEFAETTVRTILSEKKVKNFIKKVQYKIYGEDPALHIKECAAKGIKVADEIMMNEKVKPHIRQEVAFKFMERAWGKPAAELNLGEGTVRKILHMLQKPIDSEPIEAKNDIEDAQYTDLTEEPKEVKEEPVKSDNIDDWINKNIK